MKRMNIYVSHAQIRKLKRVSEATELPMNTIIRKGVDLALKKYAKSAPE